VEESIGQSVSYYKGYKVEYVSFLNWEVTDSGGKFVGSAFTLEGAKGVVEKELKRKDRRHNEYLKQKEKKKKKDGE